MVAETVDGNALSTTYARDFTLPAEEESPVPGSTDGFGAQQVPPEEGVCEAAGPQSGPMGVGIVSEGQTATVTIHNTFGDPQADGADRGAARVHRLNRSGLRPGVRLASTR